MFNQQNTKTGLSRGGVNSECKIKRFNFVRCLPSYQHLILTKNYDNIFLQDS